MYMPYTQESTCQYAGQCVYGVYTCNIVYMPYTGGVQVSVVDSVYIVYISVYGVYTIYRRDKSV